MYARSEVPKMVRQSVWSLDEHAYWINWPFFPLVSRVLLGKMALWIHRRRIDEEQNETPPRVYLIVDLNIKTRGSIFLLAAHLVTISEHNDWKQNIFWQQFGKFVGVATFSVKEIIINEVFFLELKVWKRRIKYQVFPLFLLLLF